MKSFSSVPSTRADDRIERYVRRTSSASSSTPKAIEKKKAVAAAAANRIKSIPDEDMKACYTHLKSIVPRVRAADEKSLTEIELLQHIIDYIQDLQETLQQSNDEGEAMLHDCGSGVCGGGGGSSEAESSGSDDDDDLSH
ncbi:DNA-binding protein inhibitor ID-3-like [Oscarella lobularis]|uniref:DNA-binding protein inhibitor ID-3-like n=1 Tax=Oscarella lobularis TaxID=121494 RepID=UPI003313A33F